jgi:hypothetical protein
MIFLTFLSALLLSGIAEYYSVIGLASIFPGAFWPVITMGGTLGFAKIITTSWVYRNWKTAPRALKYYLTGAVVILMMITSMGIFGYLSKAHLEHSANIGPVADKVAMLDEKIKIEKENIDANRKALKQLDESVDQIMGRSTDEKGADKSVALRKSQQKERSRLLAETQESQRKVAALSEEKAPIANELRKAESDFGPIKYVAELIYGSGDRDVIDKAVRLVIILIMLVFDPLAVLLLIAGNITLAEQKKNGMTIKDDTITHYNVPVEPKVEEPVEEKTDSVEVQKENIAKIEESEPIVIDVVTGETMPALTKKEKVVRHDRPGFHTEEHIDVPIEPSKKLEPKYDYDEPFAFKKKENK